MNRAHCISSLFAAAILLASPCLGGAGFELDQLRIPHRVTVLDNGLTLVVHEDHSVPIVSVNVWYHVGSRNESRGRTGLAHLFEHFFFNGSENYPHGFREAMDDIGANNRNGTTSTDRTNFFEDVPTSGLERTLYLESDRMGFLSGRLSVEMLERERGVVQNEKRQGENRPYGRVYGRIVEAIYPYAHPYSWSTIGKMEDLEAAGIEDVRDWLAAYYGPNNCVLTLAGDVTYESALELVDKYFGSIPPGPPVARYRQWVPELDRNLRDQMQDRAPQARIYRVYHVPGWGDNEIERLKLVANVLSGSKSSRLDRRLIYEKELATSVSASVWDKEIAGNFIVVATIKPGVDPSLAERELDSVLAEFLESGPTEAELERARNRDIADLIRGMERLGGFSGRSAILSESTLFGGTPDAYLDQLKTMTEATPVHVRDTGRRWLDAHHYTLTVVPYPQLAARTSQLDRSILPELADPPEVTFPEVQRGSLDNGLELILLERHGAPIVNMTLAVDAGYAADPAGQSGIASLTLEAMESGTESRDAFEIVDELDSLGAYISTSNSLDLSFVRLRALRMHLEGALGVYADVVLNPSFPEEMVRIGKRGQLARIAQEKARPYATALRIVPRLLYGDAHAYANPLTGSGNEASVERLTRNELRQWHRTWFHPGNASLIVTGDVSMETLLPQVEKAFGDWKPGAAPKKNVADVDFPLEPRVYVVNKPDAPQSVIVAAEVSQRGAQGDALAMETVMRLFGGMSTSRLNRNLRLDKHWSYGVRGSLVDARGQRPFLVVAPVQTDKTRESMIELMREIREIAGDRPVVGEEFESIKRNMVLRLPGRFETLSSLESAAETIVNFDYPAQYYYDYARNVRGLKEEDLASAAAGFIKPDHLTWVVIGDLAKIEDGIRDLGFGRIVHLDVDGRPEPNRASPR